MNDCIKTKTLNNVLLQENGILREESGLLIARLVDDINFADVESGCDKDKLISELQDFCIWLTGCGYEFTQHEYFNEQRDKLLKSPQK